MVDSTLVSPICSLSEIPDGGTLLVPYGVSEEGLPREAILWRQGAEVRAYLNECKHLPIPLAFEADSIVADDKVHLICLTHGALYRFGDGRCVTGPCRGDHLDRLQIRVEGDAIFWA